MNNILFLGDFAKLHNPEGSIHTARIGDCTGFLNLQENNGKIYIPTAKGNLQYLQVIVIDNPDTNPDFPKVEFPHLLRAMEKAQKRTSNDTYEDILDEYGQPVLEPKYYYICIHQHSQVNTEKTTQAPVRNATTALFDKFDKVQIVED